MGIARKATGIYNARDWRKDISARKSHEGLGSTKAAGTPRNGGLAVAEVSTDSCVPQNCVASLKEALRAA